jgi:hypothetical protein
MPVAGILHRPILAAGGLVAKVLRVSDGRRLRQSLAIGAASAVILVRPRMLAFPDSMFGVKRGR